MDVSGAIYDNRVTVLAGNIDLPRVPGVFLNWLLLRLATALVLGG